MLVTWLRNVAPRWPTARTFRRGEAATNSVAALGGPAGPVMQVRTAGPIQNVASQWRPDGGREGGGATSGSIKHLTRCLRNRVQARKPESPPNSPLSRYPQGLRNAISELLSGASSLFGIQPMHSIHLNRWNPSPHSLEEEPPSASVLQEKRLTVRPAV